MSLKTLGEILVTRPWPVATTADEKHARPVGTCMEIGPKIAKSLILRVCFTKDPLLTNLFYSLNERSLRPLAARG
jgi:hypothetical protein